ncbi:uncharacterized protein [Periplaneta americana]|uniref:uncharacterized protein n=1 Tax=Periplaneta americana TaxID=6978 RepID=UPI0037E7F78C
MRCGAAYISRRRYPHPKLDRSKRGAMQLLIVLACAVACGSAQFFYTTVPFAPTIHYTYTISAPVYTPTSTQFHSQDAFGQFAFHHAGDNQVRTETKSVDGAVRGAYSYLDPTGKLVNVQYVADSNGYRVLGANNLPEAPAVPADIKAPEPVQDTPEVMAARAAFQKQYEEAAKAAEASPDTGVARKKRETVLYPTLYSVLTKSKVKVHEFEPVEGAKTPADTKKFELKEKEHEVLTHQIPLAYSTLLPSSVAVVKQEVVPTVKVQEFKPVEGAPTPADTKKAELKEKEEKVIAQSVPLAYSALLPSTVAVLKQEVVPSVVEVPQLVYL